MKNKSISYSETHRFELNVYLVFYLYVFIILILANVLPVSSITYFVFLLLGITGICILIIRHTYTLSIKNKTIKLHVRVPFKIILLKIKIKDIESVEEIKREGLSYSKEGLKLRGNIYLLKKGDGIRIIKSNGKNYLISGINASRVINQIEENK